MPHETYDPSTIFAPNNPRVRQAIETRGAMIVLVPALAYTVGLWKRFQHPELCILGLEQMNGAILNCYIDQIRDKGRVFAAGESSGIPTNGVDGFRRVHTKAVRKHLGGIMRFYRRQPIPVLQVLWSDDNGYLPTSVDCDLDVREVQTWNWQSEIYMASLNSEPRPKPRPERREPVSSPPAPPTVAQVISGLGSRIVEGLVGSVLRGIDLTRSDEEREGDKPGINDTQAGKRRDH